MNRKIKVFLVAFINQTNAQNLSCRTLSAYLDTNKFKVYTLQIGHGNLPSFKRKGVRVFTCFFPVKISAVLGLIWGYLNADIVYIPRGDFLKWHLRLGKVFRRVRFKTVRNVLDDEALKSAVSHLYKSAGGSIQKGYSYVDHLYAMTPFMKKYNKERWGLKCEESILLPPSEISNFQDKARIRTKLQEILFIGNDWPRKGLHDFIELANEFPQYRFHVVGRGDRENFEQTVENENVQFHGLLTEHQLIERVKSADLNILPSRSEGLPRVWLETMANGLPSILYSGYGIEEMMIDGKEGLVVQNYEELKKAFWRITKEPEFLKELSRGAQEKAKSFDPATLVRRYEKEITDMIGAK